MKHMDLSLADPQKLQQVAHALSSELRLKILQLLDERSMNVLELSQRLDMPISTVSNSIVVLEEADLIRTERQNGVRGVAKLCSRKKDNISIHLAHLAKREMETFWDEYKRLHSPHRYKVDLSKPLYELKRGMLEERRGKA